MAANPQPNFETFPPPGFIPTESSVAGISVYMPQPEVETYRPVVEFTCPQCGADTAYSAADGGLTCTHCSYYEPPAQEVVGKGAEDFEFTVETMSRAAHGWGEVRQELQCQSCGVYTSVSAETITHTCPFCGSNKVIQYQAPQDVLRPRSLIPFQIEGAACNQIARDWLGQNWMTPKALAKVIRLEQFVGIYIPYWTFDARLDATWQAEVGHQKSERYFSGGEWKTRTTTVWKWESGRVEQFVDDMLVCGSTHLSKLLLSHIQDFNLQQLVVYEPQYLAGFHAQNYDILLEQAWQTARTRMREQSREKCRREPSKSRVRNFSMILDFEDETWRYILLPVYVSTYHYRDKVYQILVNGQNGAIAGQRPVDWWKLALVISGVMSPAIVTGLIALLEIVYWGRESAWFLAALGLFLVGLLIAVKLINDALKLDDA